MDNYQAIYDAVRSRLSSCNIGDSVEAAIRDCNLSHHFEVASNAVYLAASEYERPSTLFRPKIFIDGRAWCALYGEDLQAGVAGFGDSPAEAMYDFDRNWQKCLPTRPEIEKRKLENGTN